MKIDFKWDKWQTDVLAWEGNITMRTGRQVGKSTVIGKKAANFARDHAGTTILVIAAAQRQSSLLFEKIKMEVDSLIDKKELEYKEIPTLTKIMLKNGSTIYSLPAGRTGYFIRGFTIDLLIADEAAYIPEEVWKAVIPMIAVSRKLRGLGWIILISTPFGKGGYYYHSFNDDDFRAWHVSSEKCSRIPKDFLAKEKQRLTKAEYAQEYLGEFMDEWNQFFPTEIIKKQATFIEWDSKKEYKPLKYKYYLGVDIARYGGDENAFIIAELDKNNNVRIVKALRTKRVALTDTIGRIQAYDYEFKFRKIFVDDAGVGGGVMDVLLEKLGRKVIGLNNAKRSVDRERHQKAILKEDLYSNALMLMETGKLTMISDPSLLKSLKSITFQYTAEKRLKIFGDYSHLAEALVRAAWCIRQKGLNIYFA
jgi:hypothetical protein